MTIWKDSVSPFADHSRSELEGVGRSDCLIERRLPASQTEGPLAAAAQKPNTSRKGVTLILLVF